MRKILLLTSCILFSLSLFGQRTETVYLSAEDSTRNKYIVNFPDQLPYKGYLFMIPGMFQRIEDVMVQTDLATVAAKEGIITFIPTFRTGISSFGIDSSTQASLGEMLHHVVAEYKLQELRFYLGGFSIGGTCSIKYAEESLRNNSTIKPTAIFAIDSPLDFERSYAGMMRELRLPNSSEDGLAESRYVHKRMMKLFGGSPDMYAANYHKMAPYSYFDSTQYAIKPLVNLPIRLYTEPDVQWWLKEGIDYSQMNAYDFAAFTNELRRLGNQKVELILTEDKGYRKPDHIRHPHSWTIVDNNDLVQWLLSQN